MCGGSTRRQIVSHATRNLVEILSRSETIVISLEYIELLSAATATFNGKTRGGTFICLHMIVYLFDSLCGTFNQYLSLNYLLVIHIILGLSPCMLTTSEVLTPISS